MRTLSFGILHSCETELPQVCSFLIILEYCLLK